MKVAAIQSARLLAAIFVTAALGGCAALLASYGALDEDKAAAIFADGQAIILARLTAEKDDELFDAITLEAPYVLTVVGLATGERQIIGAPFRSPGPEARKEGWVYFAVAPGSYFLKIDPPLPTTESALRNRYRFTVSTGTVNYVGSFHASCTTIWGIFERGIRECSLTEGIRDETEPARKVASPWLGKTHAFRSDLARPYEAQASAEELAAVRPVAVATTATSVWREPDWDRLGETTEPPLIGAGDFFGGGLGGACYPPAGCGALIFVGLIVAGAVELVDAIDDAATRRKWEPCVNSLAEKAKEIDLSKLVSDELATRAVPGGLAPASAWGGALPSAQATSEVPYRSVLYLNVQRVALTDCEESLSVCVELAVRATLVAADGGKTLYDAVHLYTGPLHAADHPAWEKPVPSPAQCYSISAFCGDQGWPLLQEEMRKGVAELAGAVMMDLRLVGDE